MNAAVGTTLAPRQRGTRGPESGRSIVVFCAGTAWDGNRFPDQHVAERLASYIPVLYVDPPMSITRWRRSDDRDRGRAACQVGEGLWRLSPVVTPGVSRPGARRVAEAAYRRAIRRTVQELDVDVHAVVVASQFQGFGVCGETRRMYYATDDFVAGAELMGVSTRWLARCERNLLRDADTIVAVSEDLARKWRGRGLHPEVVTNGVDDALFAGTASAPLPIDVDLPSPIVGFVGHLSERIDLDLLAAVADRGHSVLLVGPRQPTFAIERMGRLLDRPNVQWVGAKPFESLPSYVRVMDVGLLPYADSDFNRASFPLKVLEYLAAGKRAVATDLPAVRWLGTDLIERASDPAGFARAVDRALAARDAPGSLERRQAFAAGHSWDARVREIAELLGIPTTAEGPP